MGCRPAEQRTATGRTVVLPATAGRQAMVRTGNVKWQRGESAQAQNGPPFLRTLCSTIFCPQLAHVGRQYSPS